jgi:hypothetical protein
MKHLKGLQRTLMASTVIVLAFGAVPVMAATSDTSFGACTGSDMNVALTGQDCVTAVGHISASVVGTLSINEMRAVSFGNFAVKCAGASCAGDSTIILDPEGVRSAVNGTDTITLLHGADATPGSGGGVGPSSGAVLSGSQSPGHYTVSGSQEGNAASTQVYISFADSSGNVIDACSPNGNVGGPHVGGGGNGYSGAPGTCDNYHPGNKVTITNGTSNFFVDQFTFNESGSDVYGYYIDNAAPVGPGSPTPFLPGSAANSGHNNGIGTPGAGAATPPVDAIDVVVGATLHTDPVATAYAAGKYTGIFDIMVSY